MSQVTLLCAIFLFFSFIHVNGRLLSHINTRVHARLTTQPLEIHDADMTVLLESLLPRRALDNVRPASAIGGFRNVVRPLYFAYFRHESL